MARAKSGLSPQTWFEPSKPEIVDHQPQGMGFDQVSDRIETRSRLGTSGAKNLMRQNACREIGLGQRPTRREPGFSIREQNGVARLQNEFLAALTGHPRSRDVHAQENFVSETPSREAERLGASRRAFPSTIPTSPKAHLEISACATQPGSGSIGSVPRARQTAQSHDARLRRHPAR